MKTQQGRSRYVKELGAASSVVQTTKRHRELFILHFKHKFEPSVLFQGVKGVCNTVSVECINNSSKKRWQECNLTYSFR